MTEIAMVAGTEGIRENDGKSIGHLGFSGAFEYFVTNREIYRAPVHNPIGINGFRQGARFECHLEQWTLLKRIVGIN